MFNTDIDHCIFCILPISDKRSFLRTCKSINKFSADMLMVEYEFQKMLNETSFFHTTYYSGLYCSLYKYTMELLFDHREIPDRYIIPENRVLHLFPILYGRIASRGDSQLVKKMLKLNRDSPWDSNARQAMRGAAEFGDVEFLKWTIRHGYQPDDSIDTFAAEAGKLEILKWIDENVRDITYDTLGYAAWKGHMPVLEFFIIEKNMVDVEGLKRVALCAAEAGYLDIVKFLYSINEETLETVPFGAAFGGQLEVLEFAYEHHRYVGNNHICNDVDIYKWLNKKGYLEYNIKSIEYVALNGNLECLQYIHSIGFDIRTVEVSTNAVESGNIKMIEWLINIGCPFDSDITMLVFKSAKKFPHPDKSIDILGLLVKHGCEIAGNICAAAAARGDFVSLEMLYSCGHLLNGDVISQAAHEGHLGIIIWARSKGCKWDDNACRAAAMWNHLDVLKWLRGINRGTNSLGYDETEICPWTEDVCVDAINQKQIDVLKFALDNDCDFGQRSLQATTTCDDADIVYCVTTFITGRVLLIQ